MSSLALLPGEFVSTVLATFNSQISRIILQISFLKSSPWPWYHHFQVAGTARRSVLLSELLYSAAGLVTFLHDRCHLHSCLFDNEHLQFFILPSHPIKLLSGSSLEHILIFKSASIPPLSSCSQSSIWWRWLRRWCYPANHDSLDYLWFWGQPYHDHLHRSVCMSWSPGVPWARRLQSGWTSWQVGGGLCNRSTENLSQVRSWSIELELCLHDFHQAQPCPQWRSPSSPPHPTPGQVQLHHFLNHHYQVQFHLISWPLLGCWTFGFRNAIVTVNTTTTTTIVIVTNILMPSSSRVGNVNKPPTLHEAVVTITLKRSGRTVGCLHLDFERFLV